MKHPWFVIIAACGVTWASRTAGADEAAPPYVRELVRTRCVKCHGPDRTEGSLRLDDLSADFDQDRERWGAVFGQLRDGLMPPDDEPPVEPDALRRTLAWLSHRVGASRAAGPNQGNLVPHELLFGRPSSAAASTPARVWRLSPDAYLGFVADVYRGRADGIVQPFTVVPERGLKDFAELYAIDEPSTEVLLRNAELIVERQTAHEFKDGKIRGKNDSIGEFVKLLDPTAPPDRARVEAALQIQFRLALGRKADAAETERYLNLYEKCAAGGDRGAAIKTMLQAVLLRADAMYRLERGARAEGVELRRLEPAELARAISLALSDRRENGLAQAAEKGELTTKAQVAEHVRRILDDRRFAKPRLLRFFREYFEYHRAVDVFKDKPRDKIKHLPHVLVSDTDRLVLHVLEDDRDVFRELLTTRRSFVNYNTKVDKSKPDRPLVGVPHDVVPPPDKEAKRAPDWLGGVDAVYGFPEWPAQQPVELPDERRLGVLMQPSWLVAWSTNFENDVVRRGRWIRERLLGGTAPDLPIGVAAQVPDAPHRTLRDRLQVTRDAKCWKCHQLMDELGLPFETFDHYGRFRATEEVLDPEATAAHVDAKGKSLGPVYRAEPVDASGLVARSGDSRLDGPVGDARELVRRLANSDRARQVFVRHVFRYFLGRNETLADARTLQEADRAYVESGGSFKTLLVSLLTSDSFLLRSPPAATAAESSSQRALP